MNFSSPEISFLQENSSAEQNIEVFLKYKSPEIDQKNMSFSSPVISFLQENYPVEQNII